MSNIARGANDVYAPTPVKWPTSACGPLPVVHVERTLCLPLLAKQTKCWNTVR